MRIILSVLLLLASAGCDNKAKTNQVPGASSSNTTADKQPQATSKSATSAAVVPASTSASPPPTAPPPRPGRSPTPTLADWNNQRKEVTVKGSSALRCETKIVREYLRISCHGKNDTGGTPTNVVVKKGGRGEALTFVVPGVTSLIVPFVEGTDLAADFSWTDKSHTLVVSWPRGAKQPDVVGTFEGAKSPLDASRGAALAEKWCTCHKKVFKQATCDELLGAPNEDCERSYRECDDLLACGRGEPGVWASCKPGFGNGPFGFCYKRCGPNKSCGANESCQGDDEHWICLPE